MESNTAPDNTEMLCAENKAEINTLNSHPKYGRIGDDAFKSWCSGTQPASGRPGVVPRDGVWVNRGYGCCLIGAALIGKPVGTGNDADSEYSDARAIYGLNSEETDHMWSAFDNALETERRGEPLPENASEAYRFGRAARILAQKIFGEF